MNNNQLVGASLDDARIARRGRRQATPLRSTLSVAVSVALLAVTGCVTPPPATQAPTSPPPTPRAQAFRADKLTALDTAIAEAIAAKKTPGGVLWLEHAGEAYHKTYGARTYPPTPEPIAEDTIFDAASLTKVIATTTCVMQLVERGKLDLDAPVARYLPAFAQNGKEAVTLRHLMTHMSGLRPDLDTKPAWFGYTTGIERAMNEKLRSVPGSAFVYSDINYIVLGEIVHVVSGRPLHVYAAQEVFGPLKMSDSGFLPPAEKRARIAPTEVIDGQALRGVVHDPTTRMMGGVAGHAGLFTTAGDLARFCRMLLNGGELDGVRILQPATIAEMTRVQNNGSDRRGLGWDIDSRFSANRGRWFPAGRSFGHTGYTGTSVWIDPGSRTFWIFLTNRVHPDDKANITPLRRQLATLAAEAVDLDSRAVLNGIDVLVRDNFAPLHGLRVGLITNHSGRDRDNRPTIDLLAAAPDVKLVSLFSPEHGIRGDADARVNDSIDEKTKLPVYSLYGEAPKRAPNQSQADYDMAVIRSRAPKPEQLAQIDALVFDIQDIGARFYTYSATLGAAVEAAAAAKKKIIILDRINPITATHPEGPVQTRAPSFIGFHPVPVRHGLTMGEFATLVNKERNLGADLTVIRCEHWSRTQWLDATGLPWTNPSPSMRSLDAATLYPGLCLLESTSISMGRGTMLPFEQVGAPYVDGQKLAAAMNAAQLPGVRFEAVKFTPLPALYPGPATSLKHGGKECGGVRAILTDRDHCNVVDVGVQLALVLHQLYPTQFKVDDMARLTGDDETVKAIAAGESLAQIKQRWSAGLARYEARRQAALLY